MFLIQMDDVPRDLIVTMVMSDVFNSLSSQMLDFLSMSEAVFDTLPNILRVSHEDGTIRCIFSKLRPNRAYRRDAEGHGLDLEVRVEPHSEFPNAQVGTLVMSQGLFVRDLLEDHKVNVISLGLKLFDRIAKIPGSVDSLVVGCMDDPKGAWPLRLGNNRLPRDFRGVEWDQNGWSIFGKMF